MYEIDAYGNITDLSKKEEMKSTTGTSIDKYIDWVLNEIANKEFGEVSLRLVIHQGNVVRVLKESIDSEQIRKVDK